MVMHARKTQRMSDGYFEKHQAHPYQNTKYSSSKSYGQNAERYERIRDSPNGNYRSDSPDSQSPRDRDRTNQPKSYYLQKLHKERENRDYKRDKYAGKYFSDCARSPKDKRSSRDSEHRTNHDRSEDKSILHPIKVSQNLSSRDRKPMHNNCVDKRDDRERVSRFGDWSEHISSSGKKYYYNCKTEVSQWEKPREWTERCRTRDRDRDSDRNYGGGGSSGGSSRSGTRHDKHSSGRGGGSKDNLRESATGSSQHWSRCDDDHSLGKESSTRNSSSRNKNSSSTISASAAASAGEDSALSAAQDMDISPGDSTPTSEVSYPSAGNQENSHGPVLLANALPRLISHPQTPTAISSRQTTDSSPALQSTPSHVPSTASVTTCNAPGPPMNTNSSASALSAASSTIASIASDSSDAKGIQTFVRQIGDNSMQQQSLLTVDTNHASIAGGTMIPDGPPTPTHSETPDCAKVFAGSPAGTITGATSSGLSTLQGVASSLQALRPQGPTITPSLANHVRDDLVNHVRGWPADILEKQAQKHSEEAHIMGSIQCSKVSAELKTARSIVRLTDIQATLQEQRILFLRQQIKTLEEMKSQNSFMSDDS